MAPVIDIYDATFSGITRDSAHRLVATPGDSIQCSLKLRNTGSTSRDIWWAVNDGSNRIASGTGFLNAGGTASCTEYIAMPSDTLNLKFWAGYISNGSWYWTDNAGFSPVYVVDISGAISIHTSPSGATLYVDNSFVGYSPKYLPVDQGYHYLKAVLSGYVTAEKRVLVGAGMTDSWNPTLQRKATHGMISFSSTPTLASISIGGVYKGQTPKTVQVNAGIHAVGLSMTGFKGKNGVVTVSIGETKGFFAVLEKLPTDGKIAFGSTPVGARIYVNGTYRDTTGVGLYKYVTIPAGTHNVKLMLEGYQDATATVRVDTDKVTYYSPILTPKSTTAKVRVESVSFSGATVAGASIYVDDEPTGINTPGMIDLSIPGPHTIEVKKTIPIIGTLAISKPEVVTGLAAGVIVTKVLSFIDVYKSCKLNPVPEMPPTTPINIGNVSATGLVKLGMKFVPGCTIFGVPCSGDIFPLTVIVTIAGQEYHLGISGAGPLVFDFTANIRSLIMGGKIDPNAKEVTFTVKYPTMVKIDPFSGKKETVWATPKSVVIPLSGGTPLPIICMPSISKFTTPNELQLQMPAPGDLTAKPTFDITSFPVSVDMAPVCKQNTNAASTPANLFPMDLSLLINDKEITTFKTDKYGHVYSTDLKTALTWWLSGLEPSEIIAQLTGPASPTYLKMSLKYPNKVTFEDAASTGVIDTYKSYHTTINLEKPDAGLLNICNIIKNADLTYPDSLPIDMSIPGMPSLPSGSSLISMALGAVCAGATPLNLLTNATADVSVGGAPAVSVPITGGSLQYDLASNPSWLQYVYAGMTGLALSVTIPKKINADTLQVIETETITKSMGVDTGGGVIPGGCTADMTHPCPDGTVITQATCDLATGVLHPTGETCLPTPPGPSCTADVTHTCADGNVITLQKCTNGVLIPTGATCTPTPPGPGPRPTGTKSVFTTTPLLSRVGKRIQIVGLVFCGTSKVGGEKAWISINGELLTTANTRNGEVMAEWSPIVPGLYTICITVPASSACNASANGCTMMQVVSELSQEEIEAAEEEFEKAKERIGEIMERI